MASTGQQVNWKEVIYRDMELQIYKIRTSIEQEKRDQKESSISNHNESKDEQKINESKFEANEIIEGFLWLGGIDSAYNIESMKELGINYVLNCASDDIDINYEEHSIELYAIKAKDSLDYNIMKEMEQCIKFINKCKNNNGKILIHCVAGRNRSAAVCCAYLIYNEMTIIEAYKMILNKRKLFGTLLPLKNDNFVRQLMDFAFAMKKTGSEFENVLKKMENKSK
eukprot:148950_1